MRFHDLSKTYQEKTVLTIEDLTLSPGVIYAVVGANGSGKSTLGRIAAGQLQPDKKGSVIREPFETVGYMPQKSFAFCMSVHANIMLAARRNRENRQRAQELMEALELTALARARATRLSGGETERMALARVMMTQCRLLILDEPTSALDVKSTLTAEALIRDYRDRTGATILLITHSLTQARRTADKTLFLHEGHLLEYGPTEQVLSQPQSAQARAFFDFYGT